MTEGRSKRLVLGPGLISTAEISEVLGPDKWPTHRVRRWLIRTGAAIRRGRHVYTTRAKLRESFHELYEELFLRYF